MSRLVDVEQELQMAPWQNVCLGFPFCLKHITRHIFHQIENTFYICHWLSGWAGERHSQSCSWSSDTASDVSSPVTISWSWSSSPSSSSTTSSSVSTTHIKTASRSQPGFLPVLNILCILLFLLPLLWCLKSGIFVFLIIYYSRDGFNYFFKLQLMRSLIIASENSFHNKSTFTTHHSFSCCWTNNTQKTTTFIINNIWRQQFK